MKKQLGLIGMFFIAIETYAIAPSGSRLDYGESGVDFPTPLLIIGLVIATVGCFLRGGSTWTIYERNNKFRLIRIASGRMD